MRGGRKFRPWNQLTPDVFGSIFSKLSFQEILTVIPRVCKPWEEAVSGPYCWKEINITEWSRRCQPEHIDRMLRILITRSSGSLRKLSVSGLPNESIFSFIANHAGSLQALQVPRSKISDSIVEQAAGSLSMVTFLDISYCTEIGARALDAIGRNCKSLVRLRRVMDPLDMIETDLQNHEAHAIATTMPKLKHLEICFQFLSAVGVTEILSSCQELEFLDIRGCWHVNLDQELLKEKYSGLKMLGPDLIGRNGTRWNGSNFEPDYFTWVFIVSNMDGFEEESLYGGFYNNKQRLEDLELGFSEGLDRFSWPSP